MDARRAAYLEALGVDVYVRRGLGRPAPAASPPVASPPEAAALPPAAAAPRIEVARAADPAVAGLDWTALRDTVAGCRRCGLCETRTQTVFGVGDTSARWMFIGEAPSGPLGP